MSVFKSNAVLALNGSVNWLLEARIKEVYGVDADVLIDREWDWFQKKYALSDRGTECRVATFLRLLAASAALLDMAASATGKDADPSLVRFFMDRYRNMPVPTEREMLPC